MSAPTILRVAEFTGTASPRPTPATAVLTPTTRPLPSASAPPEFPGLRAASVWMTLSTTRPPPAVERGTAAHAVRDAQVRNGRSEPVGDRDDGARVGVERLRLAFGLVRRLLPGAVLVMCGEGFDE